MMQLKPNVLFFVIMRIKNLHFVVFYFLKVYFLFCHLFWKFYRKRMFGSCINKDAGTSSLLVNVSRKQYETDLIRLSGGQH